MVKNYEFMPVSELAKKVAKLPYGECINFTYDKSEKDFFLNRPAGWHGVSKMVIFEEPRGCLVMGNYAVAGTYLKPLFYGNTDEISKILSQWFRKDTGGDVYTVCVERSYKELWEELADIPIDSETETIDTDWIGFPAGTHREDIWHWFEDYYKISVAVDLMGQDPGDGKPEGKPTTGHWIEEEDGLVVCSECGEEHEWDTYRANYCDSCGAKMIG
ncbi:MAG: hypothetical protein LUE14_07775 [Clostridiales bacterium]|nr:hypothetical protein [Clostridiales bacterium]